MTRDLLNRLLRRSGEVTFIAQPTPVSSRLPPRFHHALAVAGALAGRSVVDVGCWTGQLLACCDRAGAASLVGIDLAGPWLDEAKRAVPRADIHGIASLTDRSVANISPGEVVFFLETLEHLPKGSELATLRVLQRLVKPGGQLVLSTPAAGLSAFLDPAWFLVGHRHYRRSTVTRLLRAAGFEPVATWYSGDLAESADLVVFYLYKHVLRRPYETPRLLAGGGLVRTARRRLDSGTTWVDARRPVGATASDSAVRTHDTTGPGLGGAAPTAAGDTARTGESRLQVTIVVPTRNAARTIDACLASLRAQREPCMVVVVDNHSTDRTLAIAQEMADRVIVAGPERSAQRNAGARHATTPVVGFIDADMVLTPEVTAEAVAVLTAPGEGRPAGVIVPERSRGEGFWAEVRAFERGFYDGSDPVEAARFFCREVFDAVGGFDETLPPGPEDWDLTKRVKEMGHVARIDAWIDHDEGVPTYLELCRKKAYYAPGLRAYVAKYGASSLSVLDRPYIRQPWLLGSRGWRVGFGVLALKGGEAAAVLPGLLGRRPTGSR